MAYGPNFGNVKKFMDRKVWYKGTMKGTVTSAIQRDSGLYFKIDCGHGVVFDGVRLEALEFIPEEGT